MSWRQRLAELMVAGTVASGVSSCMNCNVGPRGCARFPSACVNEAACFDAGGVGLATYDSSDGGFECELEDGGTLPLKDGKVQGP